jgi:small-conductance mechanosensitive channel
VTVGYDSDVARCSACWKPRAAQPRVLKIPEPVAFLAEFGADGLEFTLNFWISDPGQRPAERALGDQHRHPEGAARCGHRIPPPQRVLQCTARSRYFIIDGSHRLICGRNSRMPSVMICTST